MAQTILVVEDSVDSYNLLKRALGHSYATECAPSVAAAIKMMNKTVYDLIVLDVALPDGDGYSFCSMIQSNDLMKHIPIIFLTAKTSISDKILGFQVGAEDFITKPFDAIELRARVDAKLRKQERMKQSSDIMRFGDLEINKTMQSVSITSDGTVRRLDLTQIEFKLLVFLAKQPNVVLSRDEILNTVWGEQIHIYGRSVDTHVSKLRKKLEDFADCIESVHGTGYRFVPRTPAPLNDSHLHSSVVTADGDVLLPGLR